MATFNIEELENGTVFDQDGSKVGSVAQLYLDDASGEPNWVTVNTGLFGTKETFVPLDQARTGNGEIHVPYTKDFIKDAPNLDADKHIDEAQEEELYRYYGLTGGSNGGVGGADQGRGRDSDAARTAGTAGAAGGVAGAAGAAGNDRDRRVDDDRSRLGHDDNARDGRLDGDRRDGDLRDGDRRDGNLRDGDRDRSAAGAAGADRDSVVRHEEQVNVGTEKVQTGRARLRKRVVTDTETVTVPVEREEVEVVREPIADGQSRGGSLGEEDVEVTLTEERPVVDKEVVAKERVGLDKNVVRDQEQVQTEVGREEIDVVEDGRDGGLGGRDGRDGDLDGRGGRR